MEKKPVSHIIKALIISVLMFGWILLGSKLNFTANGKLQLIPYAILVLGIVISCMLYAKQYNGALKFGDIFANGFKTTAVVALVMAIFTFIAVKYVYPPTSQQELESLIKTYQQENNIMPNEAREAVLQGDKMKWVVSVSGIIFSSIICGALGSVLGAAIAKKNQ